MTSIQFLVICGLLLIICGNTTPDPTAAKVFLLISDVLLFVSIVIPTKLIR